MNLPRIRVPILRDPETLYEADWLVLESTYGNKDHDDMSTRGKKLLEIVLETLERGGNVVIPFAVGRTQEIPDVLHPFVETGSAERGKSLRGQSKAIWARDIYSRHPECFDSETLSM